MVKRITTWMAEMGENSQVFENKKNAILAEEEYNIDEDIYELDKIFRKYFKTHYGERDKNNPYLSLCVDCGIKLLEYESNWDGHRSERGNVIYRNDGTAPKFLDGNRCEKCDKKAFKLFQKMLDNYRLLKNKDILIDSREWQIIYHKYNKNRKIILQIMEIVELWDKTSKRKKKK